VTRSADARLAAYALLAAAGLVAALALRRTELAAVAAPFAAGLIASDVGAALPSVLE
jgi:hypothetical protein